MDVYNISGTALTSNYTTNANWTTAQLFELNFAQFGDTIFITHRDNPIREIFRESATSFIMFKHLHLMKMSVTVGGVNKSKQPFYRYADRLIDVTLSSHATGTGRTVTASSSTFTSNQVGDYILINGKQGKITGFTSGTSYYYNY